MAVVENVNRELIQAGHNRSSFVIALGGGVTGDLAGFVASIFYRGIPFVQIPTTIVSQVDSAVGGKTGVNAPEGKNLIGAFHQPRLVLTDPNTLLTLPGREFREGFAEVIKHAAIRDEAMLIDLAALDPMDQNVPSELISRNVAIKARIVEADEQETSGTRALLNFGHTIGHGIEASVPYGTLLHGEAISLGIRAALKLSENHAGLAPDESQRILALLTHYQLPLKLSDEIPTDLVIEKLLRDKKFSGGEKTFILLDRPGNGITCSSIPFEEIALTIDFLRS
jgi:3-dehydroquinate synthase